MEHIEVMQEIMEMNRLITSLEDERDNFVKENKRALLLAILDMMDWGEEEVALYTAEIDLFDGGILVNVILKGERARWTFKFRDYKCTLCCRNKFSE